MTAKTLLGAAALVAAMTTGASAASFTTQEALAFTSCLEPLKVLAEEFEASGEAAGLFSGENRDLVVDGKIKPYSPPLADLKASEPAAYAKVDTVAQGCGLDDAAHLGNVADPVMAAYMAKKMGDAPMPQVTPEMMAMMPPEALKGMAVMAALKDVPKEDQELITGDVEATLDASVGAEMAKTDMGGMQGMGGMQH